MAAAVLAEHEAAARQAHVLRPHDLVGLRVLEHAVLVDARLVREGVLADDRLVARYGTPVMLETSREVGYRRVVLIPVRQLEECDSRVFSAMTTSSSAQLPARSPMPLIVHSTWRAPLSDGGQAVGHRHAQIVVAVHGEPRRLDPAHVLAQVAEDLRELIRDRVADGIREY